MKEQASAPPPGKQDPESLVLRGRPRPAIRFRRSVVVGIAVLASLTIAGAAWLALQPPSFRLVAGVDDLPEARTVRPPDVLAGAPQDYGDIPKLGPPLPGDLGRPILQHQRELGAMARSEDNVSPGAQDQARAAALQQALAEAKAARASAILVERQSTRPVLTGPLATDDRTADFEAARSAEPPAEQQSLPRKLAFLKERDDGGDLNPHSVTSSAAPDTLSAGSVIAASLLTGINSDLPGLVTAQVTAHVYDSLSGTRLLIPQGSRLIGNYDSVVAYGQRRALIAWRRILFPDGSSIRIDNWQAADARGYSGLEDKVDRHSFELLKGVIVSSLLGLGTNLTVNAEGGDLLDALLMSAQQGGSKAGEQIVSKSLDIQPTIRIRPGWPLVVVVRQDLVLKPWPETLH